MKEKMFMVTPAQSKKMMVLVISIFLTIIIGSNACQAAFKPWFPITPPVDELSQVFPDLKTISSHAATHEPAEPDFPMIKCEHGWRAKSIQCLECVAEELGFRIMYLNGTNYPAEYLFYGTGQYKRIREVPCEPHKVKWTHRKKLPDGVFYMSSSWLHHCDPTTCPKCKHRDIPKDLIKKHDCADKTHWNSCVTGELCRITGLDAPSTGYDIEWALYINGSLSTDVIWTHEKR